MGDFLGSKGIILVDDVSSEERMRIESWQSFDTECLNLNIRITRKQLAEMPRLPHKLNCVLGDSGIVMMEGSKMINRRRLPPESLAAHLMRYAYAVALIEFGEQEDTDDH